MTTHTVSMSRATGAARALAWLLAMALALFACGCAPFGYDYEDGEDTQQAQDADALQGADDSEADAASPAAAPDDAGSAGAASDEDDTASQSPPAKLKVTEDGTYTSKDEVALYIHTYGHLPSNFISKTKARNAGWVSSEGNLDEVCPGKSIGGSQFYNDDGLLPDASGRTWKECDIDYHGGYRGSKRIVFSNDGLIYYTGNHYSSFERLY